MEREGEGIAGGKTDRSGGEGGKGKREGGRGLGGNDR